METARIGADLSPNPQRPTEVAGPRGMLPQTECSLRFADPSQRVPLRGPLVRPTKRSLRVLNAVRLAKALDVSDGAIPHLALRRIARPLAQLLRDVSGRGYPDGSDRKLAALGEDTIRDGQLPPCGTRGNRHLARFGLQADEPFLRPGFVAVDPRQLLLAKPALQLKFSFGRRRGRSASMAIKSMGLLHLASASRTDAG